MIAALDPDSRFEDAARWPWRLVGVCGGVGAGLCQT